MNEDKINKRLKYFQEYIETCEIKNEYVGLGNPLADILLIGKEPSLNINAQEHIQKNINSLVLYHHSHAWEHIIARVAHYLLV